MTRMAMAGVVALLCAGLPRAQAPDAVTLAVPGRASATPWIASSGRFVAVAWGATANGASDVYVATSRDDGATFGAPVQVNRVPGEARLNGEIPPRVALHRRSGAAEPEVVVAWNAKDQGTEIKIARSRDGGRTFGAAASLQSTGAAGDRGWHAFALDDRGEAHVVWLDHRGLAEARATARDGAAGGTAPDAAHQHKGEHDGVAMAQRSGLRYARVGARTSADRELAAGVCYCCKTAIVALPAGRLLSAWRHVYDGNLRDIAFTESRDGGATFSPVARVSEDGWAINGCPDDGPALAAAADGRVHVAWPTVIPGDPPVGAIFYAAKGEAGGFGARVRVPTLGSPKPSHPQVAVDGAGQLFVAWDEVLEGVRTAAFVTAKPGATGSVRFGAPTRVAADGPTLYPVMAPLSRGVIMAWTAGPPTASAIHVRRLGAPVSESGVPDPWHDAERRRIDAAGAAPTHRR
jgi:hypothetical protein